MTEEEKKIFWKLDDKIYLVDKNKTYKKFFKHTIINNSNKNIQEFINRLIAWYYVKYSDNYIEMVLNNKSINMNYSLVDIMSFDKLYVKTLDMINFDGSYDDLSYQYLIVMAGWGLIYDRKTTPDYGLFRAKEMFKDFNLYYNWDLDADIYNSIMNYDYSLNNKDVIKLLEKKKYNNEKDKNKNKLPKIRKLFRR